MKMLSRKIWEKLRHVTTAALNLLDRCEPADEPKPPHHVQIVDCAERLQVPYYDTWRSWVEGTEQSRLFSAAYAGDSTKTNFYGAGAFPAGQTFTVRRVGIQVEASSPELQATVTRGVVAQLVVANKRMCEMSAEYLRAIDGFVVVGRTIHLAPLTNFCVELEFSAEARQTLDRIKGAVGPGCGWARVKVTLDGILKREVR